MNRKGFTLIELLVTIALLAIISLISFVSVKKIIQQSKMNECNTLAENIKNAAKEYASDNRYKNSFINNIINYQMEINSEVLVNNKYLNGDIINPFSKETINPGDISLTIYFKEDYTTSGVVINGPSGLINDCNIIANIPAIPTGNGQSGSTSSPSTSNENNYTVTLNGNGATSNGTTSIKVTPNSSVINPATITLPKREYTITYAESSQPAGVTMPVPDKVIYTFEGWYDTQEGDNLIINKTPTLTYSNSNVTGYISDGKWIGERNTQLYAKWTIGSITLPTLTKPSYRCTWNTKYDGTGIDYLLGEQNITTNTNITLYAYCKHVCCHGGIENSSACSIYGGSNACWHNTFCEKLAPNCDKENGWVDCTETFTKCATIEETGCNGSCPSGYRFDTNCHCVSTGGSGGGGNYTLIQ